MGGKALSVESIRLGAEDYFNLYNKIDTYKYQQHLIPSNRQKESFGDMDILIGNTYGRNDINYKRTFLSLSGLEIVEEHKNGDVTSFGVSLPQGIFQVDIIGSDIYSYPFALHYFSYNDAGNLIGRIARGLGLKFGHDGLWYTQRNEHTILKNHLLTQDFKTALEYLGLDAHKFFDGFDTMEEVFQWIIASPYYDWNRFDLSQRNYRSRVRDSKRENYRKFLEWAKDKPTNHLPPKETFLTQHCSVFIGLDDAICAVEEKELLVRKAKEIYNGKIVADITGLQGKELGMFMKSLTLDAERVLEMGEEGVLSVIKEKMRISV